MDTPDITKKDIQAIECMLCKGFVESALKLIHCLIEEMAYLCCHGKENHRRDYIDFINKQVFPHLDKQGQCSTSCPKSQFTAEELYLARCGAIHSGTWKGSGEGKTLKWLYEDKKHRCTYPVTSCDDIVLPHLNDFWKALKDGIQEFFLNSSDTATLQAKLKQRVYYPRWEIREFKGSNPNIV